MQRVVLSILVIVSVIPLCLAEGYCGEPMCYVVNEINPRNRHVFKINCDDAGKYLPAKIIRYRCARDISIGDLKNGIGPLYEITPESGRNNLNPTSSGSPPSPLSDCGEGWTLGNTSCYKFLDTAMTWDAATTHCASQNISAHIVFIESDEEENFISEKLQTTWSTKKVWIGLKKEGETWKWQNNKEDISTGILLKLNGNACNDSNVCASIKTSANVYEWKCLECSIKIPFICEV